MLLTGVHSVVLYSFSEVLINLPRLSYFSASFPSISYVRRPLAQEASKYRFLSSFYRIHSQTQCSNHPNGYFQSLYTILRLISTQNKQKIRRFLPHFTLNAILKIRARSTSRDVIIIKQKP